MGRVYEGVGEAWVAHNEHGSPRQRKVGKRVHFYGTDLYSYNTVVARYCGGGKYVLASSYRYSQSTSSHISNCVRWCAVPVIYTPDIWADDKTILADLVCRLDDANTAAVRGWKKTWRDWSYPVVAAHKDVVEFCQFTGLSLDLPPINEITAEISMRVQEKWDAWNHPSAVAKRERHAARHAAKQALNLAA